MASRDTKLLDPNLLNLWRKLYEFSLSKGIDVIITCTYRSGAEQNELYAQGRTKSGRIVTWAKAGQSKHNLMPSKAFDIAIIKNGKCVWDISDPSWEIVGKTGTELGLKWGGNWKSQKREFPHFEIE